MAAADSSSELLLLTVVALVAWKAEEWPLEVDVEGLLLPEEGVLLPPALSRLPLWLPPWPAALPLATLPLLCFTPPLPFLISFFPLRI